MYFSRKATQRRLVNQQTSAWPLVILFCYAATLSLATTIVASAAPGPYHGGQNQHRSSSDDSFPLKPPESEDKASAFLLSLDCRQPQLVKWSGYIFRPLVLLTLAVLIIVAALALGPKLSKNNLRLKTDHFVTGAGSLIVAMSLIFGLHEWHVSLEQEALANYENEIAKANKTEEPESVLQMMAPLYLPPSANEQPDYARSKYVYVCLDNLEFSIERYRQGLASAYTTSRAVMTFASRCRSVEFRKRAAMQVIVASYSPVTIRVVQAIIRQFK